MNSRLLSAYTGTTRTFTIAATRDDAPYVFPAGCSVIFTAKRSRLDPDSAAVFQKALGYGITVSGRNALLQLVPEDLVSIVAEFTRLEWDLKAQEAEGGPYIVAEGLLEVRRAVTEGIQSAVPIYTSQPPVPGGGTGEGAPLSNTAAAALGATASAGTSSAAARGDHVHARPSLAELGAASASHTHAAADITQDATHRFVTDAEKTTWNAGGSGVDQTARDSAAAAQSTADIADTRSMFASDAAASALSRANHTGTQAAATIDQDSTHRFVTDSEKATWNSTASGGLANPMTTAGDIIVGGSAGTPARLGIGSEGQSPIVRSGALVYETPAAGSGSGPGYGIFQYSSDVHLHFAGDSLSNPEAGRTSWPEKLYDNNAWLSSRVSAVTNSATPGRTMAGVVTAYTASDYPNRGGNQSWYFLWVGANNIAGSSPDTGAFITAWIAHLQQLRTDGWSKIVAFTIMRRSDGTNGAPTEAARQVINAVIRRRSDLWDYLIEPDVLFPDETNTTWFDGNIHLTAEADARLAKHVAWVLSSGGAYNLTSGAPVTAPVAANQLAPIAAHTFFGNNTGATAAPSALTAAQVAAELPAFVGDSGAGGTKGLVPAPSAGDSAAGKFLKADGTFAVPPAASGMSNPLTTAGDLLVGGASGTPSRLGIGSAGQVLQVVDGVAAWAANAAGFSNPMTTAGDLIVGGTGGAAQRLAIGPIMGSLAAHPNGSLFWRNDRSVAAFEEDFLIGIKLLTATVTGTSAAAAMDNTVAGCGVLKLETGSTATGRAVLHGGTTTYNAYRIGTTPTFFRAYCRIPVLSDSTDTFTYFLGLNNQYGGNIPTGEQIMFSYTHGEDGGNWRLTCRTGSSESTTNGVAVAIDTDYRLEWFYDGSTVTGWVNGTNIGTISTNIPTGAMGPIICLLKSVGTTNRAAWIDYVGLFALPTR
jgi:hypothetical protein